MRLVYIFPPTRSRNATEDISRQLLQISGLQCLCFLKISDNAFHPHSLQNHCSFVLASSMSRKMCVKTFAVTTHFTKPVATLSLCMNDLLLSRVSNFGIGFPPTSNPVTRVMQHPHLPKFCRSKNTHVHCTDRYF